MKKKYKHWLLFFIFFLLYLGIFLFPSLIIETGIQALTLFKERLFPSIFPFFVLSFLLLNLNFASSISRLFAPLLRGVFHLSTSSSFVFLMSIISGFPSGAKYTALLYQKKQISKATGNYLLLFTHYANPLFVLGSCSLILQNHSLAILIFFCQLISNFLLGFFFRPKEAEEENTSFVKETSSVLPCLSEAINQAMEVLLFMLGSITFFLFVSKIFLVFFPLPPFLQILVTGIFDMTSGIAMTQELSFLPFLQGLCVLTFLVFGGFSVHLQVKNAIKKTDLSYRFFFLGRILQLGIAILLFVSLYPLL